MRQKDRQDKTEKTLLNHIFWAGDIWISVPYYKNHPLQ